MKILIADDSAAVRDGITALLKDEPGFEVVGQAQNGLEALQKAQDMRPDLVILDMRMPGLDGVEVTRRLNRLFPDIKIIGLSMYDNKSFAIRAISEGASGYILKKHVDSLVEALNTVSAGGRYLSPEIERYFT